MRFYLFTEKNDHEGETWSFFIPAEGNGEVLDRMRALLTTYPDEYCPYTISTQTWGDMEVDAIIRADDETGGNSYMPRYQKVAGVDSLPDRVDWESEDPFYKGNVFQGEV